MGDDKTGRVVIITGAAGGVGTVVTRRWLEAGASVLAVSGQQESLDRLRDEIPDTPKLAVFAADITTEEGTAGMVAEAERAFGQAPDTLLHLVGGFGMGALDDAEAPALWEKMMAVNLLSAFHAYRAMIPVLKARGGGWIVGLGSRAAVSPGAKVAAYAASKAGLIALTQSLSAEVKDAGIHVNVLLASTIDTPANRRDMGEKHAEKWVRPDDIADTTLYICSEQARAIHGATIEVYARA
jgi:NAD(P)-dependent dehydrogenase (short-subunit alcohol dehydrogenase family)